MNKFFTFGLLILLKLFVSEALASPAKLTYQGRITNSSDGSVYTGNAQFRFTILADSPSSCVLYRETIATINLASSFGVFNVTFGDGTPDYNAVEATTIHDIFKNSGSLSCENASTYSPTASSSRWLKVEFNDGTAWRTLDQNLSVNSVPFASNSMDASKLGGQVASSYMQKPGAVCASGVMGFDGTSLTCTPISSLAVDWASLTGKPTTFSPSAHTHEVDAVVSAAGKYFTYKPNNVACSTNEVLKWDGTRWICGTDNAGAGSAITDLTGDVTASGTGSVAATVASVGGKTATEVATAVDNIAAVSTTYLAKVGGTMTGAIDMNQQNLTNTGHVTMYPSKTLHLSNNASSPAGSYTGADSGKIWYNSVSNKLEYWDGSAVKVVGSEGGSASDLTSITGTGLVQRTGAASYSTLGVGSDFVITGGITLDLTNSGVTAGTYTKLTVDAKGRVTTATNLSASDIPNIEVDKITSAAGKYFTYAPNNVACADGQILKKTSLGWECAADATGGSPADASYAAKGVVQFDTDAATSGITVASGVASVNAGTAANQIVKLDGTAKLPAVDGSALTNITTSVDKITSAASAYFSYKPNNVECADGEFLKWTAATDRWECGAAGGAGTVTSIAAGTGLTGGSITSSGTIGLDAELAAVNALSTTGYVQRTGAGAYSTTAGNVAASNSTVVTRDGSGVSGFYGVGIQGATAGTATIQAPSSFTNYSLTLPVDAGTNGQVLQTNGSGVLSWVTQSSGADNLGNHTATQNIQLGSNWLSSDGGNEGLNVNADGNVGIGTTATANALTVNTTGRWPLWLSGSNTAGTTVALGNSSVGGVNAYLTSTGSASPQGAGNLVFNVGGTDRLTMTNTGNFGFDTSHPVSKMTVNVSSNTTTGALNITNTSAASGKLKIQFRTLPYWATGGIDRTNAAWDIGLKQTVHNSSSSSDYFFIGRNSVADDFVLTRDGDIGIGTMTPGSKLDVKGALRLSGSTSGYAGFQPATDAGSTVWTLPTVDGSNGQVLTTNGSGILSWSSPSGTPADASYAAKGVVQFDADAATSGITVASGVASVNAGTAANQIVKLDGTAKLPAVDGSALTNVTTSVDKITSAASAYFSYKPNNVECANGEFLQWAAATDRWECSAGSGVASVTSSNSDIAVANTTTTPSLTLNSGTVGGAGDANKIAKLNASGVLASGMIPDLSAAKITSGTLAVVQGGTGATSFSSYGMILANSTGSALTSLTCAVGESAVWTVTGFICGKDLYQTGSASSVNYVRATGAAASGVPVIEGTGLDTNVTLSVKGKGTGQVRLDSTLNVNSTYVERAPAAVTTTASTSIPATTNIYRATLSVATTTFTMPACPAPTDTAYSLTVKVQQDATGGRVVDWTGASITWDSAVEPEVSTSANAVSIYQFLCIGGESTWYGMMVWKAN